MSRSNLEGRSETHALTETAPEVQSASSSGERTRGETVLEIDWITRAYEQERAVADFSLSVADGELVTLLGPSGCGKTTTLRIVAGLERPTTGSVRIDGETVADERTFVKPEDRDVGLVFQDFALFPHLSIEENITFGIDNWDRARKKERTEELLELIGMLDHRDKQPDQLSGGQKQRVALARSLAPGPKVLLLDEPFSNLDVSLRTEMREEVRRILKETGVTAISVTHDQEEALSISDRVAIMNDGRLEQVGKPESVFENPQSRFVASFLGRASFLQGRVRGDVVETELGQIETAKLHGPISAYEGAEIDVLLRPDDLEAIPANRATADGLVVHRQYTGPMFVYRVQLNSGTYVRCLHNHSDTFEFDQPVSVSVTAEHSLAWYPRE